MEKLIDLYKKWAGEEPADVIKLAEQGSNRQYFLPWLKTLWITAPRTGLSVHARNY